MERRLPPEIWSEVFKFLRSPKYLSAVSLVNRELRQIAAIHLYRRVRLRTNGEVEHFCKRLLLEANISTIQHLGTTIEIGHPTASITLERVHLATRVRSLAIDFSSEVDLIGLYEEYEDVPDEEKTPLMKQQKEDMEITLLSYSFLESAFSRLPLLEKFSWENQLPAAGGVFGRLTRNAPIRSLRLKLEDNPWDGDYLQEMMGFERLLDIQITAHVITAGSPGEVPADPIWEMLYQCPDLRTLYLNLTECEHYTVWPVNTLFASERARWPRLQKLDLRSVLAHIESDVAPLVNFLTRNNNIRVLTIRDDSFGVHTNLQLPPQALPRLTDYSGPTEYLKTLMDSSTPGRPIGRVDLVDDIIPYVQPNVRGALEDNPHLRAALKSGGSKIVTLDLMEMQALELNATLIGELADLLPSLEDLAIDSEIFSCSAEFMSALSRHKKLWALTFQPARFVSFSDQERTSRELFAADAFASCDALELVVFGRDIIQRL